MKIKFPGQVVGCAESRFWIGSLFCSADFLFGFLFFKLFLGVELDRKRKEFQRLIQNLVVQGFELGLKEVVLKAFGLLAHRD